MDIRSFQGGMTKGPREQASEPIRDLVSGPHRLLKLEG